MIFLIGTKDKIRLVKSAIRGGGPNGKSHKLFPFFGTFPLASLQEQFHVHSRYQVGMNKMNQPSPLGFERVWLTRLVPSSPHFHQIPINSRGDFIYFLSKSPMLGTFVYFAITFQRTPLSFLMCKLVRHGNI